MRHDFAVHFAERLFKSSYNQQLNSHDSEASHIAKYDTPRTGRTPVFKQLIVARTKLNVGKRAFSVAAPTINLESTP